MTDGHGHGRGHEDGPRPGQRHGPGDGHGPGHEEGHGQGHGPGQGRHERTGGGDPVCWLDRVCEECGAMREETAASRCARCGALLPGAAPDRVLVFTATAGYRHESIPAGVAALTELAASQGLSAWHTEDPAELSPRALAECAAVVFLSPTEDVLDDGARQALRAYVTGGGGFLGVHAATCAEYGWPWYGELTGARFTGHPPVQAAVVTVGDREHPATAHLPREWAWTDEWYDFEAGPRGTGVRVLASVDERRYEGGTMGADHPLVWCAPVGAGRSFYTALGHLPSAYADPDFRRHLLGALLWCVGRAG